MSRNRRRAKGRKRAEAPSQDIKRRKSETPVEHRDRILLSSVLSFQAGDLASAENTCRNLLSQYPRTVPAILLLGMIAARTDRAGQAGEHFREVLALAPKSVEARTELAALLNAAGDWQQAVAICEEAADLRSDDAGVHNLLGLSLAGAGRLAEAVSSFRRATLLKHDQAQFYQNLGVALQALGRDLEAMTAFRQAVALAPDLSDAHARLGHLLIASNKYEEGLASLHRAAAAQPKSASVRVYRAEAEMYEGRVEEAEASVREALRLDPESAAAHHFLALLLQQKGDFAGSLAGYRKVIELQPRSAGAYLGIAGIKRFQEADRPVVAAIESLVNNRSLGELDRINLHYALGKALEDLGDYEGAMHNFDDAHRLTGGRLLNAGLAFDRDRHRADNDLLIAGFTQAFFADSANFGSPSELPVLIVGMPRSGTTLVEQMISNHPDVGAGGEQTFWPNRTELLGEGFRSGLSWEIARQLAEEYLSALRIAASRRSSGPANTGKAPIRITDKMPANFLMLGYVHLILPKARIIHCRRNALDTCLSIYTTPFRNLLDFAHERSHLIAYYEEYARLMAHWRAVLPPERFLEVDYETLVADPETTAREMIEFCGLPWAETCLNPQSNRNPIATPSAWQARQPIYRSSVERWRRYEPWLGEFAGMLDSEPGNE